MFRTLRRRIRQKFYFKTENLVRCLRLFHDVVSETPLADKYWVCCGMLLGYAREGQLIKNDFDFDFHYWSEDVAELETALERLQAAGFKRCFRWVNNEGHTTEYALIYKEIKFEFFEATRTNGNIHWYTYHHRPPRQYINEVPAFELEPFEFYDRSWLKPVDHEAYLEQVYGDWRTPDPAYSFYEDCTAIVGHEPWTGDNRW